MFTANPATLVPGPDLWWQLLLVLFLAGLGSTVLGSVIDRAMQQRQERKNNARIDVGLTLDKLEPLRAAYQAGASNYAQTSVADPERDSSQARLENSVYIAIAKTADKDMMQRTTSYIKIAQRFAIQEETASNEQAEFFKLLGYFTEFVKKNR